MCNYTCLTCANVAAGTSDFECATCSAANNRSGPTLRRCPCSPKYYDNNVALCASCYYACATCTSFGIN